MVAFSGPCWIFQKRQVHGDKNKSLLYSETEEQCRFAEEKAETTLDAALPTVNWRGSDF